MSLTFQTDSLPSEPPGKPHNWLLKANNLHALEVLPPPPKL